MAQPPLAILTLPELLAQDSDSQVPACIAPVGSSSLLWSSTLASTEARPCGHLIVFYGHRRSLLIRTLAPVGTC